jgi:hypothetical protein
MDFLANLFIFLIAFVSALVLAGLIVLGLTWVVM